MTDSSTSRIVWLAGATGLVGSQILECLLADPDVARIHALTRRPLSVRHDRLQVHQVDFASLPALPAAQELYLALGTTIKVAGSQAAFRAVDLDANLAVAKAARRAGVTRVGLVSAAGANSASRLFYSRVKGELEDAVAALDFAGRVFARPSLLLGERHGLNQPARLGERLAMPIGRLLASIAPAAVRPVAAQAVARTLVDSVPTAHGTLVLDSGTLAKRGRVR